MLLLPRNREFVIEQDHSLPAKRDDNAADGEQPKTLL